MLINRKSRDKYTFSPDYFRPDGHVVFSDLSSARGFAFQMSAHRIDPISATDLYALSLLDEAFHILVRHFYQKLPGGLSGVITALRSRSDLPADITLRKFIEEFPPTAVFQGVLSADEYLSVKGSTSHDPDHERSFSVAEDMLLIHNSNQNPALEPFRELIDESGLSGSAFREFVQSLLSYSSGQTGFDNSRTEGNESLAEILNAPIKASPKSLEGQLRFIVEQWGSLLGEKFSIRLLRSLDFLREETIRQKHGSIDSRRVETHATEFSGSEYAEYERYSPDREWMPRLVLLAKNTYVWLGQLSKKYQLEINRLDQIPDEELDLLASRGFTGLWLIGLWERSRASERIKQRMGQGDAVASAYSLHSYDIAADLGGWDSLSNLRSRAWSRGIRLSADMVPNHMGIDSTWVAEHPDWFLSSSNPPYPSYSFNSENLSDDSRVGIFLEDHYYDKTDASVVFQRRDWQTGDVRYIYHGNDGTSFPWNDTAQLDYTNPAVREAVIQVILHVARNFPVIRFDAAMTLAKKHVQRLWFPEPGAGGAIPSRSQYGMTRSEFDEKVPEEFWREVVDRVAREVPDTLLLAEAFWLMEGYFVRTLGMHRVYNSAFMHMLRDEDNAKYRLAIKNTLEFDPQILKRYVNFMNNPDEKSAVEQFGSGDKYFGICTLLATLPGLPMFGHGQVEGYSEKYGMEFRHAKWDELPDERLIRGHEWRIFPLLHRRYLFTDVEQFLLYDFYSLKGGVDEEVFAYSNRFNDERGLVLYHNKFTDTRGWIMESSAYSDKTTGNRLRRNVAEGLGLPHEGFAIFTDYVTRLEYIRSCREIWDKGLFVELGAYQSQVFMDWYFVEGSEWAQIYDQLNGAGVQSMQTVWKQMFGVVEESSSEGDIPAKKNPTRKAGIKPKQKRIIVKKAVKTKASTKKVAKRDGVAKVKAVKKIGVNAEPILKVSPKSRKPSIKKPLVKKNKKVIKQQR